MKFQETPARQEDKEEEEAPNALGAQNFASCAAIVAVLTTIGKNTYCGAYFSPRSVPRDEGIVPDSWVPVSVRYCNCTHAPRVDGTVPVIVPS